MRFRQISPLRFHYASLNTCQENRLPFTRNSRCTIRTDENVAVEHTRYTLCSLASNRRNASMPCYTRVRIYGVMGEEAVDFVTRPTLFGLSTPLMGKKPPFYITAPLCSGGYESPSRGERDFSTRAKKKLEKIVKFR